MTPRSRALILMVAVMATNGCLLFPARKTFNAEVAELESEVAGLEQRVGRLEAGPGVAVSGQAGGGVAVGGEELALASAQPAAPRPGIKWPGFPSKDAFVKFIRGITNALTGWVEIPKRMHETTHTSGAMAGFTYGFLRGIGHGFVRTLGGAYEVVTFPFPAPPDYRPVMKPAYIFSCEE